MYDETELELYDCLYTYWTRRKFPDYYVETNTYVCVWRERANTRICVKLILSSFLLSRFRMKTDARAYWETFYFMETCESIKLISLTYSINSRRGIPRSGNFHPLSNKTWEEKLELWGPPGPQVVGLGLRTLQLNLRRIRTLGLRLYWGWSCKTFCQCFHKGFGSSRPVWRWSTQFKI